MGDFEFAYQVPKKGVDRHKRQQSAAFRESIVQIVDELDEDPGKEHSLTTLFATHTISRRRFYDVINVLVAIGCCRRTRENDIIWVGRWNIEEEMNLMKKAIPIGNDSKNLNELFPADNCVCLTSLTVAFLTLFGTLSSEKLDLREAASFFSRGTERYKTTLCKLYQISLILSALGILERTAQVCEVSILSPYKEVLSVGSEEVDQNPLSISYLLNGPTKNFSALRAKREREYRRICENAELEDF